MDSTEENNEQEAIVFPVASLNARAGNFFLDTIVRILISSSFYKLMYLVHADVFNTWMKTGDSQMVLIKDGLITFIISVLYYFIFEFTLQRTPAKFVTRTYVVRTDGHKPTFKDIFIRTLSRLVPFEPFSFLVKIDEAKGWHDRWSKTCVVKDPE